MMEEQLNTSRYAADYKKDSNMNSEKAEYSIDMTLSLHEYMWATKKLNGLGQIQSTIYMVLLIIAGIVIIFVNNGSFLTVGVLFICIGILLAIIKVVGMPASAKRTYGILEKNGENVNHYDFYKDHLVRINVTGNSIIKYEQFDYIVEDDNYFLVFIPVNKILVFDKSKVGYDFISFIKEVAPEKAVNKAIQYKKRKTRSLVVFSVILVAYIALTIFLTERKPKNDYPYSTYESFYKCLEEGTIEDVVIKGDYVTYDYIGRGEDEYFNTKITGEKDELIELLEEMNVDYEIK